LEVVQWGRFSFELEREAFSSMGRIQKLNVGFREMKNVSLDFNRTKIKTC